MASVYLIIGIVLSLVGFYIKYELKQDGFCISGGDTAIFAIISFIISIFVFVGQIWMVVFLLPYAIIQYNKNKKTQENAVGKITGCEFCLGTGIGIAFIFVAIFYFVFYMFKSNNK